MRKSESLHIVNLPVGSLIPHTSNARTHSRQQIRQIAKSIATFGYTTPVLIDRTKKIIAWHGRVAAAKLLGLETIPTIELDTLSEDEIRTLLIVDNRIAEQAGGDRSILAIELQHLITAVPDLDLSVTGFSISEIDLIKLSNGRQARAVKKYGASNSRGRPFLQATAS